MEALYFVILFLRTKLLEIKERNPNCQGWFETQSSMAKHINTEWKRHLSFLRNKRTKCHSSKSVLSVRYFQLSKYFYYIYILTYYLPAFTFTRKKEKKTPGSRDNNISNYNPGEKEKISKNKKKKKKKKANFVTRLKKIKRYAISW